MASLTWTPPAATCPRDIDALRAALTKLANAKAGKKLIADKFTKDHVYAGHTGPVTNLASTLAKLRELPLSTLLISSMDSNAQKEVLNWIQNIPAALLTFNSGTWTLSNRGSAVTAVNSYKFATVDLDELKGMNADDRIKKSRKWLTESLKTPKVACQFGDDGTPLIYHLDF